METPSPELLKQVLAAASRADRFAFTAAARKIGSLEDAQTLVRSHGIVRMVDRVVPAAMPTAELQPELLARATNGAGDEAETPTMFGHFAVFNEFTEIDSWFEGHFMERIAPGAFKKTFRENRAEIKSLFQHGHDPTVGDKPLGPIDELREDETGGYYEVPLLDAPYVRDDILPGLEEGLYGASFRFQMIREEFNEEPDPSDGNPKGLPERTLKELRLFEFGPVTFPAYASATAAVRQTAPPADDAELPAHSSNGAEPAVHLTNGRRSNPRFSTREEYLEWISR